MMRQLTSIFPSPLPGELLSPVSLSLIDGDSIRGDGEEYYD